MEDKFMHILPSIITVILMLLGFLGSTLYIRGNITARLDAHDKVFETNGKSIDHLNLQAEHLVKEKADKADIVQWRLELKTDFQCFKDDIRENIKEFKTDVQNDINNVLVAFKKHNGNS